MLKLFHITYYRIGEPVVHADQFYSRFVMAYNESHAIGLLYREFAAKDEINVYRHSICEEVPCLNPLIFKS